MSDSKRMKAVKRKVRRNLLDRYDKGMVKCDDSKYVVKPTEVETIFSEFESNFSDISIDISVKYNASDELLKYSADIFLFLINCPNLMEYEKFLKKLFLTRDEPKILLNLNKLRHLSESIK